MQPSRLSLIGKKFTTKPQFSFKDVDINNDFDSSEMTKTN